MVMNSKQHRTHCACASTVRQHLVYSVWFSSPSPLTAVVLPNIALFVRMRLPRTPGTTCRSIQQCQTVPLPTRATDSNHPRKVESLPVVEDARAELVGWQAGGLAGGAA